MTEVFDIQETFEKIASDVKAREKQSELESLRAGLELQVSNPVTFKLVYFVNLFYDLHVIYTIDFLSETYLQTLQRLLNITWSYV